MSSCTPARGERLFSPLRDRCSLRAVHIRCPICKRELPDAPDDFAHRPFCSSRCKTVDLGRWLDEEYRISTPVFLDPDSDDEYLAH